MQQVELSQDGPTVMVAQTTAGTTATRGRARALVILLQASVLALLVAVPALWVMTDKKVTLVVDGVSRTISTHSGTVAGAMKAAHLTEGTHDLLAPAASVKVKDGESVTFRHGRQITVTVDGTPRTVWVTALTVDEAMSDLNLDGSGAYVSASRSRPLSLTGDAFEVREAQHVQVVADGTTTPVTTTAATVRDVLAQANVTLNATDTIDQAMDAYPVDGMAIDVTRITSSTKTVNIDIPFASTNVDDPNSYVGTSSVTTAGVDGVEVQTFALTFTDGLQTSSVLTSDTTPTQPVTQVTAVGSKPKPKPVVAPRAASSGSAGGSGYDVGDGLNWAGVANCESSGNPQAVGGGGAYRGLYQFSISTWQGVGGAGDPIDASVHEQTYRAHLLYQRSGASSWPVCGQYL